MHIYRVMSKGTDTRCNTARDVTEVELDPTSTTSLAKLRATRLEVDTRYNCVSVMLQRCIVCLHHVE
jgi:hypothetical protein